VGFVAAADVAGRRRLLAAGVNVTFTAAVPDGTPAAVAALLEAGLAAALAPSFAAAGLPSVDLLRPPPAQPPEGADPPGRSPLWALVLLVVPAGYVVYRLAFRKRKQTEHMRLSTGEEGLELSEPRAGRTRKEGLLGALGI